MIVGTICFATCQGIAHLARDFYQNGIIHRVLVHPHPHYPNYPDRYPGSYTHNTARQFLDGLDILLLFENGLDWDVVRQAVSRGVKIVVMPMYEYTPYPFPVPVDLYLCPSLLDMEVYEPLPCIYLPVPVCKPWTLRKTAHRFIHNAGHGQWQYGKGTPELLEAMNHVTSPVRLLVRGQPGEARIEQLFKRYQGHPRIDLVLGELPEAELYEPGDVFVYPERYNGLSLPLQEAYASGMLVMATDHFPANTWLPTEPLIPVAGYEQVHIATTFRRAILDSKVIAHQLDTWYGQDITDFSQRGRQWALEHSWDKYKPRYLEVLDRLL